MKQYNDCTDYEKKIIREYSEWCKSDCDLNYRLIMVAQYRDKAITANIDHLLTGRN